MALYERILVGVDLHRGDRVATGEPGLESKAAIEEAIHLAIHSAGSVTFCSSLDVSAQAATLISQDHQNLVRTVEDIAAEMLDRIVAEATARGVKADKVVRIGSPHEQLSKVALDGNYNLVVVGTRARSKVERALFGSTAQKLIRSAPCAVWVVKPETVRQIREVAVATDLSESCRPALSGAVEIARALAAKLYVVHAVDLGVLSYLVMAGVSNEQIADARKRLFDEAESSLHQQLAVTDYRTLPHGIKVEIVEGSPDDAIPKFVIDNEVDILVMGTHGRSGISRLVLGNTAERILPTLNCSVIAVKPLDFVSPFSVDAG